MTLQMSLFVHKKVTLMDWIDLVDLYCHGLEHSCETSSIPSTLKVFILENEYILTQYSCKLQIIHTFPFTYITWMQEKVVFTTCTLFGSKPFTPYPCIRRKALKKYEKYIKIWKRGIYGSFKNHLLDYNLPNILVTIPNYLDQI